MDNTRAQKNPLAAATTAMAAVTAVTTQIDEEGAAHQESLQTWRRTLATEVQGKCDPGDHTGNRERENQKR